jgi:hypothetical protein
MNSTISPPASLKLTWLLCFGGLVLAFPFYSYLVFGAGQDRNDTADLFAIHVTLAYWIGILAPLLPLHSLKHWTRFNKLHTICLTFMLVSYLTHLSWELLWLIFHEAIASAKDEMWAYAWWAYIDGGDLRYYQPKPSFLMIEVLSVCNGLVGMTGLILLWRSGYRHLAGTLMCMSTAVTHTVLTWYYYGTEILTGFESVNTASVVDLWVKFVLLNGPWLVFPWLVLYWGYQLLKQPNN